MRTKLTFLISLWGLLMWSTSVVVAQTSKPDSNFHIYLLMGQSNMAGRGQLSEKYKAIHNDRVKVLSKDFNWITAHHPLHYEKPAVDGVGPGLSFGIAMAKRHPGIIIGLVPCAIGGSPIEHWVPGAFDPPTKTYPWDDAAKKIAYAMKTGVIKGVIWHQGESDSHPELAAVYLKNLQALIKRIREVTGDNNLPFIAGELGRFYKENSTINAQLQKLQSLVPFTAVVSSEGLVHKGDTLHFDSRSADKLGKRYAKKMREVQSASN
ncbi:sialate O-acetylesterase [Mucilaginibacter sp. SMC90]|uniref:sialate O-acetylesterase n=1 Tax=Mucilaginibacter sp. SMC90 TaxID=2929803 RepID=UPI001FB20326|nr:sialate O-acetylesterase [Mucilaginibacter sp. SMC90]UOE52638.1 sialate O-acetylesterase [Mucilaginibacter sp. SMC90]